MFFLFLVISLICWSSFVFFHFPFHAFLFPLLPFRNISSTSERFYIRFPYFPFYFSPCYLSPCYYFSFSFLSSSSPRFFLTILFLLLLPSAISPFVVLPFRQQLIHSLHYVFSLFPSSLLFSIPSYSVLLLVCSFFRYPVLCFHINIFILLVILPDDSPLFFPLFKSFIFFQIFISSFLSSSSSLPSYFSASLFNVSYFPLSSSPSLIFHLLFLRISSSFHLYFV